MAIDYYDIDDILSTAEKIPCKFNMTIPGLGYLEGNPGRPIQKDSRIELPLWLAEPLAVTDDGEGQAFINLEKPDSLGVKVMNAIKADPVSLDVHSILPNYYKIAEKWCNLFSDQELSDIVQQMIKQRAVEIYSYANNANKQVNNNFILSLDEFEKKLFRIASESNRQLKNWLKE